jgi:RNA polymerase-interacting CarD/CdnL/TRCF family regulator
LQWLKEPSKINGDNLNNVKREASRYVRNKKRKYLKDKINELAKNIRDLYRGINEFKRGYQPRNNLENYRTRIILQHIYARLIHIYDSYYQIYACQLYIKL